MEGSREATESATASSTDDHQIDRSTDHPDQTSAAISKSAGAIASSNPTTAAASAIQQDVKGKQTMLDSSSTPDHAAAADHTVSAGSLHFNDQETTNAASQETLIGCEPKENISSSSLRRSYDRLLMPPPPPGPVAKRRNPDEGSSTGAGGDDDDDDDDFDDYDAIDSDFDDDEEDSTNPFIRTVQLVVPPVPETALAPGSRRLPPQAYCFHKDLDSSEVGRSYAVMNLTQDQASTMPSSPQIMTADSPYSSQSKEITVFDGEDRRWNMTIITYRYGGVQRFKIIGAWVSFVVFHDLMERDTICMYKNLDPSVVAGDHYYVILHRKRRRMT